MLFPAKSVCDRVMFFTPSPEVRVIVKLKAELVQVADDGEATPEPETATVSPVSQAPLTVSVVTLKYVLARGDEIESVGEMLSYVTETVFEARLEFKAES